MKKEKQMLLDDVQEQMNKSSTFLVARYEGLTGTQSYELRRGLGRQGAYLEVVRKRMLVYASKGFGVEFSEEQFPGHIGLILGFDDPIEIVKLVFKFSTENGNVLELLGGFIEGQKASAKDVQRLAALNSKKQMRAEFLGLLEVPVSQLLAVFESLLLGVVRCIDSKAGELKEE